MQTPTRIVVPLLSLVFFVASCGGGASRGYYNSASSPASSGSRAARSAPVMASTGGDDYGDDDSVSVEFSGSSELEASYVGDELGMAPSAAPGRKAAKPITPPATKAPAPPQTSGPKPATTAKRPMLIYRATINLAVFEARKSIDEVETLAKSLGGYLVQRSDTSITIRVPAGAFDNALETVAKVGDELHRQVQVQDVTAEFRDLQIRLKNLQAVRVRLAALLDRAKTVQEALRVERELERVAGNIESIKGKLKLYSELVAFSTITVNFQARPAESISSEVNLPFPWLGRLGLSRLLDLN
ncbi:MAG: DUF4349 domain-containing protein [Myxococcales bacterium]|nr:DUF4349 domain-containing protein [Myxococcales bacterium]